jgi:RNA polymerase sigma-70 factor, ECF subfamily
MLAEYGTLDTERCGMHRASRHARIPREEHSVVSEMDAAERLLMQRMQAGDEEALGAIYDRYGQTVFSLALHILHDAAAAEEITQEAFLRLWQHASTFDAGRGTLRTWLLRIAHNLALNEVRRRQSRPQSANGDEIQSVVMQLPDRDPTGDPVLAATMRERAAIVQQCMAELPNAQRQAIALAFYDGLSQSEIAERLGEPLGTVKARIRRGMQRLRELLAAAGLDESSVGAT